MEKINSVLILSLNREKLSLFIFLSQHLMQMINFHVIWSSPSWSKTTWCIFKEQI